MTEKSALEAEYDAITDAAAHWCMRLHADDCTAGERQAFADWHDAHPLHAFEYAAMLEIWDVADHLPRSEPAPAVLAFKPRRRLRAPTEWDCPIRRCAAPSTRTCRPVG